MADLQTMYPGVAFSPQTALTKAINEADTVIFLNSTQGLPQGPNLLTIGTNAAAETVLYAVKLEDRVSGCTRGVEGEAKAWQAGELAGRNFTAADYEAVIQNITALNQGKQEAQAGKGLSTNDYTTQEKQALAKATEDIAAQGQTIEAQGAKITEQGQQIASQGEAIAANSQAIEAQGKEVDALKGKADKPYRALVSVELENGTPKPLALPGITPETVIDVLYSQEAYSKLKENGNSYIAVKNENGLATVISDKELPQGLQLSLRWAETKEAE